MIAIYCRVSSSSQTLASQLPDLKRWVKAFANDGEQVKWYRDTASGTTMNRPGWNKLQADIDAGKVQTVVCWRIDRLGRTAAGLSTLFADLTTRGINLVSIKDALDLSTPAGRLMANVLSSVANSKQKFEAERQLAGIERAKAEGKTWGGSKPGRRVKVTRPNRPTRLHEWQQTKRVRQRWQELPGCLVRLSTPCLLHCRSWAKSTTNNHRTLIV